MGSRVCSFPLIANNTDVVGTHGWHGAIENTHRRCPNVGRLGTTNKGPGTYLPSSFQQKDTYGLWLPTHEPSFRLHVVSHACTLSQAVVSPGLG